MLSSEVRTYRKLCGYCKSVFYVKNPEANRVSCGLLACRREHSLFLAKKNYRAKTGLKDRVKKCLYCSNIFTCLGDKQVTCGRPACKVKRSTDTQIKRLSIEKACRFCGKVFKCLGKTKYQSDRRRVACGKPECQKARRRSYFKKPVSKELTARYWQRHKAKLAIIKELERLAGI